MRNLQLLTRFVAVVLVVFMLTSCGGSVAPTATTTAAPAATTTAAPAATTTAAPEATATPVASEISTEPAAPEPVTLTAFVNFPKMVPNIGKWGDDYVTKEITKLTGVTIEMTWASTSDNTELQTLLASGDELPDFIVTGTDGANRSMLVSQDFVAPLNKLADELYPDFWKSLPVDADKVYQEPDGNFYLVTDWYMDTTKVADYAMPNYLSADFAVATKYYEEMGKPDLSTMDQFITYLKDVKAKYPDVAVGILDANPPTQLLDGLVRIYGGTNRNVNEKDGKIESSATTAAYKSALQLYNRFFREGLINPQQFTNSPEQTKAWGKNNQIAAFWGQFWNIEAMDDDPSNSSFTGILTPMPEGRTLDQLRLRNGLGSIGGWHGTFITNTSKNKKRAIEYLAFMQGMTGQILQRNGVEGITWDYDADGIPADKPVLAEAIKKGDNSVVTVYGVYNYDMLWQTSSNAEAYSAINVYKPYPSVVADFKLNGKYCYNERLYDLTIVLANEDDRVLQKQIDEIIMKNVSSIVLSENDAEFDTNYAKFLSELKTAGIEKLQMIYQANYDSWKAKGLK